MRTNTNFVAGDTVKMRSGGHEMTIRGFEKTDSTPVALSDPAAHVRCEWMSDDGKIHSHVFSRDMLDGVKLDREDSKSQAATSFPRPETHNDDASGVRRALVRQDAATNQDQDRSGKDDPREIPGGIPQNKVAPPPDRLWNEDANREQPLNADRQGRPFASPAQHQGVGGGPGSDTH